MKETHSRTQVAATRSPGLHNDFSDQEESMTRSAMPPKFALTAGAAADADPAKAEDKPQLNITGVPPELVVMLEHFEGIRWNVYEDQLGNLTGGMGHLIKADEKAAFTDGAVISHEQVQAWAQEDVTAAWQKAQEQSAELGVADHDFYVAMASMCFQNGLYWNTKHVKTWALMKEHKWEEAALECADSDWARETPTRVPGFQAALRSQIAGGGASPAGTTNVETHIAEPFRNRADDAKAGKGKESKPERKTATATAMPEGKEGLKQVQTKLQALGLYSGKIDGIATSSKGESNTIKGIKQFQQSQGLPVTGEVDAATWDALRGGRKPSLWTRFMAKQEGRQKAEKGKAKDEGGMAAPFREMADEGKVKETKPKADVLDADGWTIAPFLGADDFYTQIHSAKGGEKPIPRPVAFSGALAKYDHGGSSDIYDESKSNAWKKSWQGVDTLVREKGVYDLACKNTCDFIVGNSGYVAGGASDSLYTLLEKMDGAEKTLVVADTYVEARNRLDGYLEQGIPVVVGMDWKKEGANASATDHFVIMVGRGQDSKGKYYQFMDVGRSLTAVGTDYAANRVYIGYGKNEQQQDGWVSGKKPSTEAYYSMSEVRTMTQK